jgi:hypothetical protein
MGIFTHLIKKKPVVRVKRRKTVTYHQLRGGFLVKSRLIPWLKVGKNWVWLGSIANSKSKRQINDWLQRRKNRRTRRLDGNLTGKEGNRVQALAIRALHEVIQLSSVVKQQCLTSSFGCGRSGFYATTIT